MIHTAEEGSEEEYQILKAWYLNEPESEPESESSCLGRLGCLAVLAVFLAATVW